MRSATPVTELARGRAVAPLTVPFPATVVVPRTAALAAPVLETIDDRDELFLGHASVAVRVDSVEDHGSQRLDFTFVDRAVIVAVKQPEHHRAADRYRLGAGIVARRLGIGRCGDHRRGGCE
jgi:hypothetical protein